MRSRPVSKTHSVHLRNPKVAAEYINQALDSDDLATILMAIRNVARTQEDGIAGLAERSHLGKESMYKMLSAVGNPKFSSLHRLMHGLGLQLRVRNS